MKLLAIIAALLVIVLVGLQLWRWSDQRHAARVWRELADRAAASPAIFDPAMVVDLPDPARRLDRSDKISGSATCYGSTLTSCLTGARRLRAPPARSRLTALTVWGGGGYNQLLEKPGALPC